LASSPQLLLQPMQTGFTTPMASPVSYIEPLTTEMMYEGALPYTEIVAAPQMAYFGLPQIPVVTEVQNVEYALEVPYIQTNEIIRAVPKIEVRTVERTIEVPQIQYQEVIKYVPKVEAEPVQTMIVPPVVTAPIATADNMQYDRVIVAPPVMAAPTPAMPLPPAMSMVPPAQTTIVAPPVYASPTAAAPPAAQTIVAPPIYGAASPSIQTLPAAPQAMVAVSGPDINRNGIPDFLEQGTGMVQLPSLQMSTAPNLSMPLLSPVGAAMPPQGGLPSVSMGMPAPTYAPAGMAVPAAPVGLPYARPFP